MRSRGNAGSRSISTLRRVASPPPPDGFESRAGQRDAQAEPIGDGEAHASTETGSLAGRIEFNERHQAALRVMLEACAPRGVAETVFGTVFGLLPALRPARAGRVPRFLDLASSASSSWLATR